MENVVIKQKQPKKLRRAMATIGAGSTALYCTVASAAPVDVTPLTDKITENESSMNTVGMAILGLIVIVVIFMMIRRMMR